MIEDFKNQELNRPGLVNDLEFAIGEVDLFPGDTSIEKGVFCAYGDFIDNFESEHPSFSVEKALVILSKFGLKASLKETWISKEKKRKFVY
ncbi:MAG: hypothetical protein WCP18_02000 [bacterium]